MANHPIEGLMNTAMENIQQMVKVSTIVGDPVKTQEGAVVIPISKVNFGFGAGGTDYKSGREGQNQDQGSQDGNNNFGGGSGAGVMMDPMAFLVVNNNDVRLMRISNQNNLDRLLDMAPDLIKQLQGQTGSEQGDQGINQPI